MKGERTFKYQKRSKEDVKERANMRGGNFDSYIKPKYKMYKVRDGKNLIRILPPTWDKARHYGYDIYVNYGIGADNQSYLSLSKMKGEPDPIVEARREAQKEGDKKLMKALEPRQRIMVWVIDRNDEDEGPQLWGMPFTVDKDLASICFDDDTKEVMYIDDPETGHDFRFHKEGTGMLTKYPPTKMKLMAASPIHEDEKLQDEWLSYIEANPVPDCLQFYDFKHIAEVFDGQVRELPEDDDEEPKPKRRPVAEADDEAPKPRRRPDPEPEVEDEPAPRRRVAKAEPEEVEDEEPARPAARARSRVVEEDEAPAKPAGESIRERLARRRTTAKEPVDLEDE